MSKTQPQTDIPVNVYAYIAMGCSVAGTLLSVFTEKPKMVALAAGLPEGEMGINSWAKKSKEVITAVRYASKYLYYTEKLSGGKDDDKTDKWLPVIVYLALYGTFFALVRKDEGFKPMKRFMDGKVMPLAKAAFGGWLIYKIIKMEDKGNNKSLIAIMSIDAFNHVLSLAQFEPLMVPFARSSPHIYSFFFAGKTLAKLVGQGAKGYLVTTA